MVTFVPGFTTRRGAEINAAGLIEMRRLRAEHPGDPLAVEKAIDAWFLEQGELDVTPADIADHIDHVRDVAGIDAIGVGGDYDGVPSIVATATGSCRRSRAATSWRSCGRRKRSPRHSPRCERRRSRRSSVTRLLQRGLLR
jgi:microsomal dipeptidase-like Zn-dependent dipeptidase